jgi:pyrimidine operon attenuation protein/uracil phosphoribosyltransferase
VVLSPVLTSLFDVLVFGGFSIRMTACRGVRASTAPDSSGVPHPTNMNIREKAQIMTATEMERALNRLAHEIVERHRGTKNLALIGIRRRGVPLAKRLAKAILDIEKVRVPVGYLDINLYRDDLSTVSTQPVIQSTEIHFPIVNISVVLVDDVLYTGRTVRAAMDALLDYGRPKSIQLCVLIDRGHRELPIEANYIGKFVQTTDNEIIEVKLTEVDQQECVMLVEKVE